MSYPAVVICDECEWIGAGIVYEDRIVPTGIGTCPGCGGEEWREFADEE